MLSNKDKQELFALSNKLKTRYIIGKDNLDDKVLEMLDKAFLANELIKVAVNKNANQEVEYFAKEICKELNCSLVKTIGKTMVLYRPKPRRNNQ